MIWVEEWLGDRAKVAKVRVECVQRQRNPAPSHEKGLEAKRIGLRILRSIEHEHRNTVEGQRPERTVRIPMLAPLSCPQQPSLPPPSNPASG
jgi:hypothetical protein